MEKIITGLLAIIFAGFLVFVFATLAGTMLWLVYPHIFALFPSARGIIANHLGWWDSVCVTWIFGTLFKSTTTSQSK